MARPRVLKDSISDSEMIESLKPLSPSAAYLMGFNEYAGKLFIPSRTNIDAALVKIRGLRQRAKNDLQRRVLDSVETAMRFDEPQPVLDDFVNAVFNHMVKEASTTATWARCLAAPPRP